MTSHDKTISWVMQRDFSVARAQRMPVQRFNVYFDLALFFSRPRQHAGDNRRARLYFAVHFLVRALCLPRARGSEAVDNRRARRVQRLFRFFSIFTCLIRGSDRVDNWCA